MAFMNNINKNMTAADARAVAGQQSWMDIYPEGFDPDQDPWDFVGEHRLYFDTEGKPHLVQAGNPFSGPLGPRLREGEKDGLLARKNRGDLKGPPHPDPKERAKGKEGPTIRYTVDKNQREPVEWDHIVIGLTRAEAQALGPEGLKEWAKVVVGAMQDTPGVGGKRQMLVTGLHTDTDHVHLQFLLHRIPVDEAQKIVHKTWDIARNSQGADQMKQVNTALIEAGLPVISGFQLGGYSVAENRVSPSEELARAAERVVEAGGIVPPDLTTGPLPVQRERVTPEMRHLDAMLADAVKQQKEAEARATAAATAVAAAQHAKEALSQYEAEVKAREAVEANLAATVAELDAQRVAYEETAGKLLETAAELESALSSIDELSAERDGLVKTVAERDDTVTSLESTIEEMKTSHAEALDQAAADLLEAREAGAKVAADLEGERAGRKADQEAAAAEIEKLRAEIAAAKADAEQADRLRTLAESQLETEREKTAAIQERFESYRNQITMLDEVEGQPVAGDGIDAIGSDRRKAVSDVSFPADAKASRRFFGRQRFEWQDGTTVLTTRTTAKLTHGNLTPAAIATMIAHAKREGWSPIAVSAHAPAIQKAIAEAARSAGLVLEGEEPAASIAPAAQRGQRRPPSWATKAPAAWTKAEREAAQKALDKAKEDGRIPPALPLDDFGRRTFEDYQKRQEATGEGAALEPKKPQ
ncbi:hypothetical protein N5K21_27445 [Rhizobium pusense]|uniref:hypothetical protein n=1 Tax=Agrobacterium pusense TaxID=648995 RepID=UPI002447269C|nr:hypothetical protein [Agrobacterium pusense]MDH2092458.1 hypothetical protein [Agrobacterium pusense]